MWAGPRLWNHGYFTVSAHQLEVGVRKSEERQQVGWWNIGREAVQTVSICVGEEPDGHGRERRAEQVVS